jgi:hypothetical protein
MSIYTAIFGFLSALGLTIKRQQEAAFLFLSLLFLLFFMGTRYEVGCDFTGYQNRFENIDPYASPLDVLGRDEMAFVFLEYMTRTSGADFVWLIFLATAIIIGCYWAFLRKVHSPILILALLFPIMMLQLGMSGIRQGIAVGFLLVAMIPFMSGKRLWTGFWILVGAQFHTSVIILLPIAFLAGREIDIKRLIAAMLLLPPLAVLIVGDRVELYQDRYIDQIYGDQSSDGAVYRYLLNLVPAIALLIYRNAVRFAYPREFSMLYITAMATVAMAPLTVLSTFALHRLNFYMMPFTIMMAIYLISLIPTRRERMIAMLLPFGAYGGYTILWQSSSFHYDYCYSVYQSYLFL